MASKAIPTAGRETLTIAHIADCHLRDRQYATPKRGKDFAEALHNAVYAAIAAGAKVIVAAGDIFDIGRPSINCLGQLKSVDDLLIEKGVPMLCNMGNHDWSTPSWICTLFDQGKRKKHAGIINVDDTVVEVGGFRFGGVSHRSAPTWRDGRKEIDEFVAGLDVLIYHGFVKGIVDLFTKEDTLTVEDFPTPPGLKAILLGDIHVPEYIRSNGVLMGYPGSTEMCSASEPTQKFVQILKLNDAEAIHTNSVKIDTRPFIQRSVRTQEDADTLMGDLAILLEDKKSKDPVCVVQFDRNTQSDIIRRIHSVLDANKAIIRCYPLPVDKVANDGGRTVSDDDEVLDLSFFVSERFKDDAATLRDTALRLAVTPPDDATGVIQEFINKRKAELAVREEDLAEA